MTAAILSVAIRPAIAGLAESFGSAGTVAGGVMGGIAGETLSKLLLEHGKKGGAAAGAASADEFNEQFKAGYQGGRVLKEVAAQSGDAFTGLGGKLAANVLGEFNKVVAGQKLDLSDMMKPFQMLEDAAVGPIMATVGKIPLLGGALRSVKSDFDTFTAGAADVIQTVIDIGDTYIEASRKIAATTLDTSQLEGLTSSVRDIMASGAIVHFDDVASAIGRLNTNISNLSSEQLKELTTNFATAEELVGKIDPTRFAGVVNAWGIGADQANNFLTQLTNTSRLTGQEMGQLMNEMQQVGPSMRAFGYDAGQTAQFFAEMTKQGEPAQRAVFMWTHAFSAAVKAGVDPKEWLHNQLTAIKEFIASGDVEEASKLFEKAFGQRATPLLLEDVKKGLLDLPELMKPLAGIDEPIKKGVEETKSLGDAFEVIGHQIQAALEPVGMYLAKGLVAGSNEVSGWLAENQDKVVRWGTETIQTILKFAGDFVRFLGDNLVWFSAFANAIKEVVTGAIQFMLVPIQGLIHAMAALPFIGDKFKGAKEAIDDTFNALSKMDKVDLSHIAQDWGHQLQHLGDNVLPGLSAKVGDVGGAMADNLKITEAFTESVNGELKPAFDQIKDKSGQLLPGTAEAPTNLQLLGSPDQWADITNKLSQMGIQIKTNTAGVIESISFANQKAHDQWDKWYAEASKKGTPVDVKLNPKTKDGKDVTGGSDLVPPGGADVPITVMPKGVSGYTPGGIPIPTYAAPGGGPPRLSLPQGGAGGGLPTAPGAFNFGPAGAPQAGDTELQAALRAKGFTPEQIRLVTGFSQVEGPAAPGVPSLGFVSSEIGTATLQGHVDALADQFQRRASVAGAFPTGGTDEEQAQWIARLVGQSGQIDYHGEQQPADYVQRVVSAMQGIPRVGGPGGPGPTGTPSSPINVVPAPGAPGPGISVPGMAGTLPTFNVPGFTPHLPPGGATRPGPPKPWWTTGTHPKDAYSVPEDQFNEQNPPPAPDGAKGWQHHSDTKSWIAVDGEGNPVKGAPPAPSPPPQGRTFFPPAPGAGPLTGYVNTPHGLVPVQGGGQLGGFPVPPSVAQGAVGMKVPSVTMPDSPLYGVIGGKGGYSQRSLGEILGGPPGSGPGQDLKDLLSGAVGPAAGLPKGLKPIYGPPVYKPEDLFGLDVGGRQGGGDIPWLPGTQWGQDGVHLIGAPGEHMWSAPEVAAAGGHHQMTKMRNAALNGKLQSLQPGGPVGQVGALNTQGAQVDTIAIGYAIEQAFGITNQGFYNSPDGMNEHSSGEAVDIMVGLDNPVGNQVKDFALANAAQFGVQYALWQQTEWDAGGGSSRMDDRGNPTQNHRDHVHIRTLGGGYPPGGGPGPQGTGGGPSSGQTSNTPAPAAAQMVGTGTLPMSSFQGMPGSGGTGGTGSQVGPGGPSAPGYFSPFGAAPPGLSGRQMQEWTTSTEEWQQSQIGATSALQKAQAEYGAALQAATQAQNQFNADAAKANTPEKAAAMKDQLDKEAALVSSTGDALGKANDAMVHASNAYTIEMGKAPPKPPTPGGEGQYQSMSQQLGQGLVKGLFQGLGFPDVFGKPFTEWGISKLLMGGLGWGLNLLNKVGEQGGGGMMAGTGPMGIGSPGGGGLSGLFSGLMPGVAPALKQGARFQGQPGIQGFLPPGQIPSQEQSPGLFGFGGMPGSPQAQVGPASMQSQTPANTPTGVSGTAYSPSLSITQNYEGVMSQPKIQDTVSSAVGQTAAPALSGGAGVPG